MKLGQAKSQEQPTKKLEKDTEGGGKIRGVNGGTCGPEKAVEATVHRGSNITNKIATVV